MKTRLLKILTRNLEITKTEEGFEVMHTELNVKLVSVEAKCVLIGDVNDPEDRFEFTTGYEVLKRFGLINPGDQKTLTGYISDFKPTGLDSPDPTVTLTFKIVK